MFLSLTDGAAASARRSLALLLESAPQYELPAGALDALQHYVALLLGANRHST